MPSLKIIWRLNSQFQWSSGNNDPPSKMSANLLVPHAKAWPCTNWIQYYAAREGGMALGYPKTRSQTSAVCHSAEDGLWKGSAKALQPACEPHRSKTGQHDPIHMHRGTPIKAFYPHTENTAQTPTNNIRCELPRIPNHIAHNSQKPSRKTERRHDLIHKHKNSPSRHFIQRQKLQLKHIQTNNIICKLPSVPNRIAHNS